MASNPVAEAEPVVSKLYKADAKQGAQRRPAMVWKDSIAEGTFSTLNKMRHTRGDHDVYTKKGRHTNVALKADNIRISDDGKSWIVDIFYQVAEGRKDFTTFEFYGSVSLAIPQDAARGQSFVTNARAYDKSWVVNDENHDVMDVPYKENTILADGSIYRIDNKGDDDGAVFAELNIKVPFRYLDKSA